MHPALEQHGRGFEACGQHDGSVLDQRSVGHGNHHRTLLEPEKGGVLVRRMWVCPSREGGSARQGWVERRRSYQKLLGLPVTGGPKQLLCVRGTGAIVRFAYMDEMGRQVRLSNQAELESHVRDGRLSERTELYDGVADRWCPARDHATFRAIQERIAQGGAVPTPPQPPESP